MKPEKRKIVAAAAVLYALFVLYFMFLAFNRTGRAGGDIGYTFMFVPETVPLRFPKPTFMWLFGFGNVAAYIPFGIVIPYLYRWSFARFAASFLLAITLLETLQGLTRLGSFDVDDIISNTLGASIGYAAWRIGSASGRPARKCAVIVLSAMALLVGATFASEGLKAALQTKEGAFQPINLSEGANVSAAGRVPAFAVGGQPVTPLYNAYVAGTSSSYTFRLGHLKNVRFYANYGIPDRLAHEGRVSLFADGAPFAEFSGEYVSGMETIIVPFDRIDELRIVIEGNAAIWDVGYRKMVHWWE
ncbi:VanZ family protein [Cohnella ginsengisoli]|uniref:VanZ family protein n=1 Tax=Cohnella ginsengisoli TaxID=425004 RepID=A0A9X4KK66_9BACL|nr:VanZ family protein [Cohnella ginsengisoli]MDG0793752.1 VanZ family protein [Cohnella ginsengisoli]